MVLSLWSRVVGVGKSATTVRRLSPPVFRGPLPGPVLSEVVTVGSKDEDPEARVAGSHVGSSKATPLTVIPEVGKVSENTSKCSQKNPSVAGVSHTSRALFQTATSVGTEGPSHVFPGHEPRPLDCYCFPHGDPQIGPCSVIHSGATSGRAEILAGCPPAHNVHQFNGCPVDFGHIAMVWDARPVMGENFGRCSVELAKPGSCRPEYLLDSESKTAVTGADLPRPHRSAPKSKTGSSGLANRDSIKGRYSG